MSWAVFSVRKYAKCGMLSHRFYSLLKKHMPNAACPLIGSTVMAEYSKDNHKSAQRLTYRFFPGVRKETVRKKNFFRLHNVILWSP